MIISHATPLYKFARFCEATIDKNAFPIVLDCGAGGNTPPLFIFHQLGYQTIGIDNNLNQIRKAIQFSKSYNDVNLNLMVGDFSSLPLATQSVAFTYAYNSIHHISKENIIQVISEMNRVTKQNGLVFINFLLDKTDVGYRGKQIGNLMYTTSNKNGKMEVRSYFTETEVEHYLETYRVIYREYREEEWLISGLKRKEVYLDCIFRK